MDICRKPCPDPFMHNNSPEGPDRPSLGQQEPSLEAHSQGLPRGQLLTPPLSHGAKLLFPKAPGLSLKARQPEWRDLVTASCPDPHLCSALRSPSFLFLPASPAPFPALSLPTLLQASLAQP